MNLSRFSKILKYISNNKSLVDNLCGNFRFLRSLANVSDDQEHLVVKYENKTEQFPLVWLRDNCRCEKCFHGPSQSRVINWRDFNVDVKIKSVETKNDSDVEIKWEDNHKSTYSFHWLKTRSFNEENQRQYLQDLYVPPRKTWQKEEFFDVMKNYEYSDVMKKDETFYRWLMDLSIYGVALIKNAPKHALECRKLSEKIAFIRKTHYGEDFHVVAKEGTNNVAYLANPLQLHTDLPYYDYKPGVNLLHCIVQTKNKGGENLLADAFHVVEKLRTENKQVFDLLSRTEVNWSDVGEEDGVKFYKIHRAPVISLDKEDQVQSIRHSIPQRDSYFTVNLSNVKPWYKALKIFINELYDNAAEFKTQPGDILAFDNTRLVHGRIGYQDTDNVKRFLVGHFVDWDEIYSKIRVLKTQLGK